MNPFRTFRARQRDKPDAGALYGAIVAQARLPVFYQDIGVPDTLDGRFAVLALHLFAVLHRLKVQGSAGAELAQALSDRFSDDMETVLRELGVGDMVVPKKMRRLAASSAALLEAYEAALTDGQGALATAIARSLPLEGEAAEAAGTRLASYLDEAVAALGPQDVGALEAGKIRFPEEIA